MAFLGDNRIYIFCVVIVLIIIAYFTIDYQIRNTLKHELKQMEKENIKRMKIKKIRQQKMMEMQRRQQMAQRQNQQKHDTDSYIDPAQEAYEEEHDQRPTNEEKRSERLSKDNFMMRDLI